jgi:hypothetical protein
MMAKIILTKLIMPKLTMIKLTIWITYVYKNSKFYSLGLLINDLGFW